MNRQLNADRRNARLASLEGVLHHLAWIHEFDASREEPTERRGGTWQKPTDSRSGTALTSSWLSLRVLRASKIELRT